MIEMYHVHMSYGPDSPALTDITLRIEKAEFVFITGPSGAGKTSLLRLAFLAEPCQAGQMLLFGKNVARVKRREIPLLRRRIGVVFQDFKLIPTMTVRENVGLVCDVMGIGGRERRQRINEALRMVGLEHKAGSFPLKLSGGEQQRAAIARAIVNDPPILLADEPTGNLDPELSRAIYRLLSEINARGVTVVVATHDIDWVRRTRKRIIEIDRGRVISGGMPDA
ncbi:MAG: cell division ATP-binding protein FtsE [Deltaproteobacteria bacterium]|nr:MAG: cell division ATP-binding protein FtsE [Deltaproteobacteria bacterium]